ncbi:uncharacterized protein TNCV_2136771 [Trichonephila clavipes]|nr:uncharacterized protein TNCV_2136771 [Trichonephila clavipes]
MHKKDLPAKIARWALMLEEFDYEVCHRTGRQMKHVDALSRYPIMMISSHDIAQKIKEAQNKDEFISPLKSAIKITPSDEYFLKNEILYKIDKNSELLVPEMMQREIVLHAHAQDHFASNKTESIVSQEFYIPILTKIVQDVITNCVPCMLSSIHLFPQRRGRRGHQDARVDVSYSQTASEATHELKSLEAVSRDCETVLFPPP